MQFRRHIGFMVFIGSYLPLSMILLAQDYEYGSPASSFCWNVSADDCAIPLRNPTYSLSIFIACLACFLLTLAALRAVKATRPINISAAKHVPAELMNYTLPYVVSFMSLDYYDTRHFVGLLIFLGWMFWITHKSGQLILNPVLIVFGWKHYDISYTFPGDDKTHESIALTDGPITAGERHSHTAIQDVLIIRTKKKNGG